MRERETGKRRRKEEETRAHRERENGQKWEVVKKGAKRETQLPAVLKKQNKGGGQKKEEQEGTRKRLWSDKREGRARQKVNERPRNPKREGERGEQRASKTTKKGEGTWKKGELEQSKRSNQEGKNTRRFLKGSLSLSISLSLQIHPLFFLFLFLWNNSGKEGGMDL